MADIPGIIEGASEGKGLGLRFLRHIERNSLLLFMVPGDTDDIRKEYEILLNELATFNPEMLDKQRVLAITKCDMLDEELMEMLAENLPENVPHVFISSLTGMGISQLKDILWTELNSESNKLPANASCTATRTSVSSKANCKPWVRTKTSPMSMKKRWRTSKITNTKKTGMTRNNEPFVCK